MKLELTVPSMVCGGCVDTVKDAIAKKDADAAVSIDLETKKVVVETDCSTTELKEAIAAAGHTVEESIH